jgi:nicotianamine synthase
MSASPVDPLASELAGKIHRIYQQLALIPALDADARAFSLVTELLRMLSFRHHGSVAQAVADDPVIAAITPNLQRIFATGSYLYERQSARRMLAEPDVRDVLRQRYPFYQQYWRATALEFNAAAAFLEHPAKRVLLAGSGPLPLTSIVMAERFDVTVDNLDIEPEANAIAEDLVQRLGLSGRLGFISDDVARAENLEGYDIVWLAALAGSSRDKRRILRQLRTRMRPGSVLAVRTATQLRSLLYSSIRPEDMREFDLKLGLQPYTDNYHSVLIAQIPGSS